VKTPDGAVKTVPFSRQQNEAIPIELPGGGSAVELRILHADGTAFTTPPSQRLAWVAGVEILDHKPSPSPDDKVTR
jgi:hypothetical protein